MSEAKTVWVIEQGSYSDYRVVGVYSTEANARRVCEAINAGETYEKAEVSEWPLDPAAAEINKGLALWRVLMLRGGEVERIERTGPVSRYDIGEAGASRVWRRSEAVAYRGRGIQDVLQATVWAESPEHAIKITNEKRAQMIALDQW